MVCAERISFGEGKPHRVCARLTCEAAHIPSATGRCGNGKTEDGTKGRWEGNRPSERGIRTGRNHCYFCHVTVEGTDRIFLDSAVVRVRANRQETKVSVRGDGRRALLFMEHRGAVGWHGFAEIAIYAGLGSAGS